MDKRINAAFLTMLFILGIISVPVSAHFTMGNHTASYPFRTRNFDPHVDGLVGYVFPGSGLFTSPAPGWYTGGGTYPGYQPPWPRGNPGPTQFGPAGWYQLDANNYAPFGAILTSTIKAGTPFTTMWKANKWASDNPTIESLEIEHAVKGDLILAFNVTRGQKVAWAAAYPGYTSVNFTAAEIMIPPEFTGIARQNIVASWTNNYDLFSVSTRGREDFAYGPYWRRLRVYTDTVGFAGGFGCDQTGIDKMDDAPDSWLAPTGPFAFSPWKTFGNITFTLLPDQSGNYADEWYYIRVNDVTAPTIAAAYQFKFRRLSSPELGSVYFPYQNWPVVLVKGEVDPAIITGTIRYGGWNRTLYGLPVTLPGRVRAVGIADDPYTGKSTGRPVEARGYFDPDWNGHYEVEGVAPGMYNIYASAAGYPETLIAGDPAWTGGAPTPKMVKILKGQSYHVDGYLVPGVQIRGSLFSKCGTGEVGFFNTGYERNIKIEIYRSLEDAQGTGPGGTTKAVTWSPYGYGAATWGSVSFMYTIGGFQEAATRRHIGVGPAQNWYVTTGALSFDFQFGREGIYGTPADLDGHVPGLDWSTSSLYGAAFVSGISAGTYWVRAWLYGYVQTQADGVTFEPVSFTVPSVEWPGNIYVPFDLRLSSFVTKTVHFHDVPGTLLESPIGWGWNYKAFSSPSYTVAAPFPLDGYFRYLSAELVATGTSNYKNPAGEPVFAWAVEPVDVSRSSFDISTRGFKEMGLWYGYGRNYGIAAGLYTVKAYMWGYVEQVFEKVNLGLCGTETKISDHLYRGAKFNITIYSKDWQHPTADKYWSFPYMPIYVQIMKDGKQLAPFTGQFVMPLTMQGWMNTSVAMWPYMYNNPIEMIRTHNARAQVFGRDDAFYPLFWRDLFGPSLRHGAPSGVNFFYYDGSESYSYYYGRAGSYGLGYTVGAYPLAFETGIYDFQALTYGYVQKKPVTLSATKGNAASDILIKLTQGAELELSLKFKRESVMEGLPFDAHLRIRVLDDKNKLVGEYLTSDWWWQPQYEWTTNTLRYLWNLRPTIPSPLTIGNTRADPSGTFPYTSPGHRGYFRLNYVPAGTETVKVVIAGLPDMYGWVSGYSCDPCGATGNFGYEDQPIDAPYGIDADPNYKGGWRIQVHLVPVFDCYPGHYVDYTTPSTYSLTTPIATYTSTLPYTLTYPGTTTSSWTTTVPITTSSTSAATTALTFTTGTTYLSPATVTTSVTSTIITPASTITTVISDSTYWTSTLTMSWPVATTTSTVMTTITTVTAILSPTTVITTITASSASTTSLLVTTPGTTITSTSYLTTSLPAATSTKTWTTTMIRPISYSQASSDPVGFAGMLMGELYYTADMKPVYTNHLGPYELRYDVVVPGTHLGGESSLIFELDQRAFIKGNVVGYTYCDDWRSVGWTTVQFTAADGTVFNHYTFDGWFGAWLNSGPYTASVIFWSPAKQEGYKVQTMPYLVSDGSFGAFNVYLEQSGVPIPEFPVAPIVLASALAASLFILRRRRK